MEGVELQRGYIKNGCDILGVKPSRISSMKHTSPKKFWYIAGFDNSNFANAVRLYEKKINECKKVIEEYYYETNLYKLGVKCEERGILKSRFNIYSFMNQIFRYTDDVLSYRLSYVNKIIEISKLIKEQQC